MNANPLQQYFRQPAIYVRLPSKGKFYPTGSIVTTENNEYPVLPMTTLDEITYRTPDALFNGTAVVSVIQSCVPNIKDAWKMPGMDIDPVLIAIRIATYGHQLDIDTVCPSCSHEAGYGVDLRTALDNLKTPEYDQPMNLGDLEIYFRPMSYAQMNTNNMTQFEEQKVLQALDDPNMETEKRMTAMSDALKKLTRITTQALAQNIAVVKTPTAQVTDPTHISEWLSNCDRITFSKIRDYVVENKQKGELQPLTIKCQNCSHEYSQAITLDMTNFFGAAS